jgi:hypothetical protein
LPLAAQVIGAETLTSWARVEAGPFAVILILVPLRVFLILSGGDERLKQEVRTMYTNLRQTTPGQVDGSWRLFAILVVLLLLCLRTGAAWAASGPGDAPVYNPATKSYFQMLKNTGGTWPAAFDQARSLVFKGVLGRLAVIDSAETHEFVMRNFDVSDPMWIGLRYWCEFRMLEWVGLRPFSPSDPDRFRAWHPQWQRGEKVCAQNARGPGAYAVVYYQPVGGQSALWQVVSNGKGFERLLVEYPTGSE